MDELNLRFQTNEQVAANLTPEEKLLLLSGIICDAQDQAEDARGEIKKQRGATGRPTGGVDLKTLHDQKTIMQEQRARITYARQQLSGVKPTLCKSPDIEAVVWCIRAKGGIVPQADTACRLPDFWKYQGALFNLDMQWRICFRPRNGRTCAEGQAPAIAKSNEMIILAGMRGTESRELRSLEARVEVALQAATAASRPAPPELSDLLIEALAELKALESGSELRHNAVESVERALAALEAWHRWQPTRHPHA